MKRFINYDSLLQNNNRQFGRLYNSIVISNIVYPQYKDSVNTLLEIYSNKGDFINVDMSPQTELFDGNIYVNIEASLEKFSLIRGSYKLVIRILESIYTNLKIKEISPDRTELKIPFTGEETLLSEFKYLGKLNNLSLTKDDISNNIINYYIYENFLYVKLINPLPDFVNPGYNINMVYELTDNLVETIQILKPLAFSKYNKIKGPKFDIDADNLSTDSSVFKCWQELVGSDLTTSQQIIDKLFNTDSSVILNIDYTYFENFIFYSSASERLKNFIDKINTINEYNNKIAQEDVFTGEYIDESMSVYTDIINKIIESFDSFERYLYYIDNPVIFTHDVVGPVRPWPKTNVDGVIELKAVNHPDVISWQTSILNLATEYDERNTKSLWWSIPEHILMDESNSEYILFVNMLGQHFDNIWMYINELTQIHNKDEHPQRGPSSELLEHIAKSFGWNLSNPRNTSELWLYKLGKNSDGSDVDVDNMVDHEQQSYQVWRRIVNNLPHLLKTKGTSRSIKSLMNIFGIPNTLISIKEYGGPGIDGDKPLLIEDRYHYKLFLDNTEVNDFGDYVELNPSTYTQTLTGTMISETSVNTIDTNTSTIQLTTTPASYVPVSNPTEADYIIQVPNTQGSKYKFVFDVNILNNRGTIYKVYIDNVIVYENFGFSVLNLNHEYEYTSITSNSFIELKIKLNLLPAPSFPPAVAILSATNSMNIDVDILKSDYITTSLRFIKSTLELISPTEQNDCSDLSSLPTIKNGLFNNGFLHWDINTTTLAQIYDIPIESLIFPELLDVVWETENYDAILLNDLSDTYSTVFGTNLNLKPYINYKLKFIGANPDINSDIIIYIAGREYEVQLIDENTEFEIDFVSDSTNYLSFRFENSGDYVFNIRVEEVETQPARIPDTIEFRFQPVLVDEDTELQNLFTIEKNISEKLYVCLEYHSNFNEVEKLYTVKFLSENYTVLHTSDPLPLYNGDMWTIRLFKKKYLLTDENGDGLLFYTIGSASDCLKGIVNHYISGSFVSSLMVSQLSDYQLIIGGNSPVPDSVYFKGYIQAYKEYYDIYSEETFKQHTLNPFAYNTDSFNGAYNSLYKYYPFGVDLQRWPHVGNPHSHESSQPNRDYTPSPMLMYYFSDEQTENYKNDVETYYISIPKIGGRTIQSSKIRIEDTQLNGLLSIDRKVTGSEYDLESTDSNKLAIVFSLADQINRDIYNHVGYNDLNDSIGSPINEFESEYKDLSVLRRKYFQKYQQKNGINTFIRLLSVYDYSFFEQIKQLVPGRANLIAGILIEPHLFEKNKVKIFSGFSIENNLYEPTIDTDIYNLDSEITYHEALINLPIDLKSRYDYVSGTIQLDTELKGFNRFFAGCITRPIIIDYNYSNSRINSGCIRININGIGSMETIIDKPRKNCRYKLVDYIYDDYLNDDLSVYRFLDGIPTGWDGPAATATNEQLELILNVDQRPFIKYIDILDNLLDGGGISNLFLTDITLPKGHYKCKFYFELLDGSHPIDDIVIDCNFVGTTESGNGSFYLNNIDSSIERTIQPFEFDLITNNDDLFNLNIEMSSQADVYDGSIIRFYGLSIFEYLSDYERQLIELNNRLLAQNRYSIYLDTSYQIEETSARNISRFVGSKLSGSDFNVPSQNTIDKGPVVEIFEVDGNILIIDSNNDGNLKIN